MKRGIYRRNKNLKDLLTSGICFFGKHYEFNIRYCHELSWIYKLQKYQDQFNCQSRFTFLSSKRQNP